MKRPVNRRRAPVFTIDPTTTVRWEGKEVLIRCPRSLGELRSSTAPLAEVLDSFRAGATADQARARFPSLPPSAFRGLLLALVKMGALRSGGERAPSNGWGAVEMEFHALWRERGTAAKRARAGARAATQARPRPPRSKTVALPPPPDPVGSLAEAARRRRSVRSFADRPIPVAAFSGLLAWAARNRADVPGSLHRPYPSAGALYSLEIYPVLGRGAVDGLRGGIYRYRPEAHDLEWMGAHPSRAGAFLRAAGAVLETLPATPPVVLAVTSRFPGVSAEYSDGLAYSLVLREVGCLIQALNTVGSGFGLGCCALGRGLPTRFLSSLTGVDWHAEALVGEIAVGLPAATASRKRPRGPARPRR